MWALRTVHGVLAKDEPEIRHIGTLVHTCLAYHNAARMQVPPAWALARSLEAALEEDGRGAPNRVRTAKEIYAAYAARFTSDTWQPVAVEEEFTATIGELKPLNPQYGWTDPTFDAEVVSCRTDLVFEVNGDLWIADHKTTGGTEGQRLVVWRDDGEWKLNWQVMMNLHILRTPKNVERLGGVIRGFVIQRVKQRRPFDFDRHVVHVSPHAYQFVPLQAREFVAAERRIEAQITRGETPIPNFSMCFGRYGPCDYHALCAADSAADQATIMAAQYRRQTT